MESETDGFEELILFQGQYARNAMKCDVPKTGLNTNRNDIKGRNGIWDAPHDCLEPLTLSTLSIKLGCNAFIWNQGTAKIDLCVCRLTVLDKSCQHLHGTLAPAGSKLLLLQLLLAHLAEKIIRTLKSEHSMFKNSFRYFNSVLKTNY